MPTIEHTYLATLGGGCFWCLEAVFADIQGIIKVESGYSGGKIANPSYEQVCSGKTGHAEVVQLTFDPKVITYDEILEIFFTLHDPTQLNRQGNDIGSQYRSIIFYHSDDQREEATYAIKGLEQIKAWKKPIVTELAPLEIFYPAEEYHQNYFRNNPTQSYCTFVISPKISKIQQKFSHKLKINK
ncbi:MAG: peptide-methionine (S)-S-oxide reductase MsrA [Candidatus Hodarchaeales archaeon]|jgi:peptide-methionine (S)-S-oxide reductase